MDFISCGDEKISLSVVKPDQQTARDTFVLFLPGGGETLGKERFRYFQDRLAEEGFFSASFDFSGVGDSSGENNQSSLAKRVTETECVARHLQDQYAQKDFVLYGVSMGGYVALGVTKKLPHMSGKLIIQAPAAYAREAHTVNFDDEFTQILQRDKSWESSRSFDWLRDYEGGVLFLIGDEDEVIPAGVTREYRQILEGKSDAEYAEISGMQHNIWEGDSSRNYQDIILEKLFSFLENDGSISSK